MTIHRLWPPADQAALDTEALISCYPRNPAPTLRVNFVTSIDGAATVEGKSAGLGGPADKEIFDLLRMLCDALVVGAGTVRGENYDALRLTPAARAWRTARGLPEFPLMVVVSRSLQLNLDQLVFADAPIRPVVVTHAAADAGRVAAIERVADVVAVGDSEVDLPAAVAELHARGATQLLSEGGPQLLGALTAADLVDDFCLTVSPLLAGPGAGRITAGNPGPQRPMTARHILSGDGMVFLRYARST
jgi:riboflavin biosynthesis pyrimidine reductase